MGLENREYMDPGHSYRDRGMGGFSTSPTDRTVYILIAINVGVFLFQNMGSGYLTNLLDLAPYDLKTFQVWRLITSGFCHSTDGVQHLFFNMFGLLIFGRIICQSLGSREFIAFYLVAIVISSLLQVGWQIIQGEYYVPSLGASGATSAIFLLTAVMFPGMKVLLFFLIPIEIRWAAIFMLAITFLGMSNNNDNIAHAAHMGGCLFGIGYWYYKWNLTRLFSRFGSPAKLKQFTSRRPKLKIHNPGRDKKAEKLEQDVDDILAKIHEHGEASLTDRERKILTKASQKYRKDK